MARRHVIVAGFGFRAGAEPASFADALAQACADHSDIEIACLATAAAKARDPAFRAFATRSGLTIEAIDTGALTAQPTLTQAPASRAAHGTGSVAEAAALAAAGPGAVLLAPRIVSTDRRATCALARQDEP